MTSVGKGGVREDPEEIRWEDLFDELRNRLGYLTKFDSTIKSEKDDPR